jgi:hypothetical protein
MNRRADHWLPTMGGALAGDGRQGSMKPTKLRLRNKTMTDK